MKGQRYIYFLSAILFLLTNILLYLYVKPAEDVSENFFYYLNLFSVVTFFILYFQTIKIGGLITIHSIIQLFYFLFLYGRSLVYVFDPTRDFFETELLLYDNIGVKSMALATLGVNTCIVCINAMYFLFGKKEVFNLKQVVPGKYVLIYYSLMFWALIYAFKLYLEFKYVLEVGYIAIYVGGLKEINYFSPIIQYSQVFYIGFFSYYLTLAPPKKQFMKLAIVYTILSFLDSLKGARISFILPLFFIIWYYFNAYKLEVNYKLLWRASFFIVGIIAFSMISKISRNSNMKNTNEEAVESNIIKAAILETGGTLQVVGRYLKHQDSFPINYPYVLEPVLYPYFYFRYFGIMTRGQSKEMLEYRNSLNHQLTASISLEAYVGGRGVGSSIVAEFYQYGYFILIIFSIAYGFFLIQLYRYIFTRVILYLSPFILTHIFFIARDTAFPNIIGAIKGLFFLMIIKLILLLLKKEGIHGRKPRVVPIRN